MIYYNLVIINNSLWTNNNFLIITEKFVKYYTVQCVVLGQIQEPVKFNTLIMNCFNTIHSLTTTKINKKKITNWKENEMNKKIK